MSRDLADGEETTVQGSARDPYVLRNVGGVYSCSCPAWRNQSRPIDARTCKHLKKLRGASAEEARVGADAVARGPVKAKTGSDEAEKPPVLLAHTWEQHEDPTGWWISEKLDGVRAYWDGKQFVSRLGNRYLAPEWFTKPLPEFPLDGELWVGRKQFQQTVSIVRRVKGGQAWKKVRYVVFDAPAHEGVFEERLEILERHIGDGVEHVSVVEHSRCEGLDHLRQELARVEELGGEGLMLRKPGSRYVPGRSTTLLKVKSFQDAEARVVGHEPGKGRHKGRLGALQVVTPEGIRFKVGTGFSDAQREAPPEVGAIITYRYQELSNRGVPRFPSFVGERTDFAWPGQAGAELGAQAPPATPPPVPAGGRYFELVDDKSSKFWEISLAGGGFTVRYGKIGAKGRAQTKSFASEAAARAAADKLIAQKTAKGYLEKTTQPDGPAAAEDLPEGARQLSIVLPGAISAAEGEARYEAPLAEMLDALELGEVVGAGVRKKKGAVVSFRIDVDVESAAEAVPQIREVLLEAEAPAATTIALEGGATLPLA